MIKSNSYLTGHMYRGSAYETDNSCGNCNGANCHDCIKEISYGVYYTYNDANDDIIQEKIYSSYNKHECEYVNDNIYRIDVNGSVHIQRELIPLIESNNNNKNNVLLVDEKSSMIVALIYDIKILTDNIPSYIISILKVIY